MKTNLKFVNQFNQIGISRLTIKRSNETKKEEKMRSKIKSTLIVIVALFAVCAVAGSAMAAVNTADNAAGGGVTLTNSLTVTVDRATLQLVKQVWVGGACVASSDISGGGDSCAGNTNSITVPTGTSFQYLIFVRNTSDVAISDVRFEDILEDDPGAADGFTYTAASITTTSTAGLPTDVETPANIRIASVQIQTDGVDVGGQNYVSISNDDADGNGPEYMTIGAHATYTNASLTIGAHESFGVLFNVTKN